MNASNQITPARKSMINAMIASRGPANAESAINADAKRFGLPMLSDAELAYVRSYAKSNTTGHFIRR